MKMQVLLRIKQLASITYNKKPQLNTMPIDYQESKIYKIYNTINDDIYVGSTTQKLCERMRGHRNCINSEKRKTDLYTNHLEIMVLKTSSSNLLKNVLVTIKTN